jgi:Fic family protein
MDKTAIGYKAISEKLNLCTLPHYRDSYVAKQGRGKAIINNHHEIHIYPKSYALQNDDDLFSHLEFALKYDGINLSIIKKFFENIEKNKIVAHIKKQPTGIYSRKIWYLYEFLTQDRLNLDDCQGIKYVDLLDSKFYFTNQAIKSPRHAVNDNLLGNHQFCPFVRRTAILEKYLKLDLGTQAKTLLKKYDPHLIARACNYLYTKETMSSYQIEREEPDKNRIARFVHMLQQAPTIESLSKEKLIELQNIIVDPRFKNVNYRSNQNYVGENIHPYFQKIHYISPKPKDVPELMQGLLDALDRMLTANLHPLIIAANIAFGFVFIHPFEDGNGRIHRFLIHYILSKTHFTPPNMIFPVSSIMLQNMNDYDQALEAFSKPLLSILTNYQLSDDGSMMVQQESKILYQYIDFTSMTEYLCACVDEAIHNYIEREIKFLLSYDLAKKNIQEIVDMPDNKIDLLIKCVLQNNGTLSAQKRNHLFSLLKDSEIKQLETVIRNTMTVVP